MTPELTIWATPAQHPPLPHDQIHLWRFSLDVSPAEIRRLETLLCVDELSRARRLLDPQKSRRFVVARGRLRQILGRYLEQPPSHLQFHYSASGKPALTGKQADWSFNLSHSGALALLAITRHGQIGVDIEQIDPSLDFEKISQQFLPEPSRAQLQETPSRRKRRQFYRLWTAREALLKAQGGGFSTAETSGADNIYFIRPLAVARHTLGAVAFEPGIRHIVRWALASEHTE